VCSVCGCPAARSTQLGLPHIFLFPPFHDIGMPAAARARRVRLSRASARCTSSPSSRRRVGTHLMRGCPALLQLRISLPPLDEVVRDGRVSCAAAACVSPRALLHPHRAPPLSLTVRGVLRRRSERIGRSESRVPLVGRGLMHALHTLCPCIARRELRAWMAMGSPSCNAPPRSLVTY
jgi:hypothetical protein